MTDAAGEPRNRNTSASAAKETSSKTATAISNRSKIVARRGTSGFYERTYESAPRIRKRIVAVAATMHNDAQHASQLNAEDTHETNSSRWSACRPCHVRLVVHSAHCPATRAGRLQRHSQRARPSQCDER